MSAICTSFSLHALNRKCLVQFVVYLSTTLVLVAMWQDLRVLDQSASIKDYSESRGASHNSTSLPAGSGFTMPYCECSRTLMKSEEAGVPPSSCNDYVTSLGGGQKVVSYSLFGDSRHPEQLARYFGQLNARAEEVRKAYGDQWRVRVRKICSACTKTTRESIRPADCCSAHIVHNHNYPFRSISLERP